MVANLIGTRRPLGRPSRAEKFRLKSLSIENFKAIKHLEFEFPSAQIPGEPDIFVFGSQNGMGKTSILEAISLCIMGAELNEGFKMAWKRALRDYGPDQSALNYGDYFVRSGAERASVSGEFESAKGALASASLTINRELNILERKVDGFPKSKFSERRDPDFYSQSLTTLVGAVSEPLMLNRLIYLHSYRKVVEGMPDFGAFIGSGHSAREMAWLRRERVNFSAFKISVLATLIGQNDLFESEETGIAPPEVRLEILNSLLERFVDARVSKLKPIRGNTIDIRVSPLEGGPSFSIDGLSSGQKEIVSTLFMIWQQTYGTPSIVLIDEPELHLNAEWHRLFVEELYRVAPNNQYIIATHSEFVAESVPAHRRAIMGPLRGR